ncbi:flagellar basal body-associated FliL family protein [Pseudodesulfovibrio sp. JC047]|uniref:flagellar basal body-associated FliL family protein n=1 Tax=Pseudodesulfovibrio sp. JC047 TaxID=2683199 RepID=UPI001EF30A69|nr:flagellar basal body-associated FliL family protein [Pseudodesulfovibrio sp. JC047]
MASPEENVEQPKAQLDDTEVSRATQKVDLDLDDAPFLEDEDDEEILDGEEETPLLPESEEKSPNKFAGLFKNKIVLVSAGIILLLVAVIILLLLRKPEAPPPPPPPLPTQTENLRAPETTPVTTVTPQILIRLDPFLIEQKDAEGTTRFLEIRVLVSTDDEGLSMQFKQETYAVRNALFYYLKNKDLEFLSDTENSDKLKKELLAIINQYMGFGQFETLMFEQYLVR